MEGVVKKVSVIPAFDAPFGSCVGLWFAVFLNKPITDDKHPFLERADAILHPVQNGENVAKSQYSTVMAFN
jgi:hypothetical protein